MTEPVSRDLADAVYALTCALEKTARQQRSLAKTQRWMAAALALVIAMAVPLAINSVTDARAQGQARGPGVGEPAVPRQGEPSVEFTPKEQAQIAKFKEDLEKVQYLMRDMTEQDARALVALFLFRTAEALSFMPKIYGEMQVMNDKMSAVPFIAGQIAQMNAKVTAVPVMAAEMREMSAKMGVMTAGIDSTMGRMGRWMTWWPW